MCAELQRLSEMNWPGTVLEPVIRNGNPNLPEGHPERDGLVGDLLVRGGVHSPQTDTIIDVQVIYLNAPSRTRQAKGRRGRPKSRYQQASPNSPDVAQDSDSEEGNLSDKDEERVGVGDGTGRCEGKGKRDEPTGKRGRKERKGGKDEGEEVNGGGKGEAQEHDPPITLPPTPLCGPST